MRGEDEDARLGQFHLPSLKSAPEKFLYFWLLTQVEVQKGLKTS